MDKTLTVDQLTIGDPHGPCLYLTATGVAMFGARNKLLASLKSEFDYTSLTFHDHNGKERIEIRIDDRGSARNEPAGREREKTAAGDRRR